MSVAIVLILLAAMLAASTPLQGSCRPTGTTYLALALAAIGVFLACSAVRPISGHLEARRLIRLVELHRAEEQIAELQDALTTRSGVWWRRLLVAVLAVGGTVLGSALGVKALVDVPALSVLDLGMAAVAVCCAVTLISGPVAWVGWWAMSWRAHRTRNCMIALSAVCSLAIVAPPIVTSLLTADSPRWPVGSLAQIVLVLPVTILTLVMLNTSGPRWGNWNPGAVTVSVVGMSLRRRIEDLRYRPVDDSLTTANARHRA